MVQKIITHTTLAEQQTDFEFWKLRPVEERIRTVEEIRCEFHR